MQAGVELYVDRASWLHAVDPRVKMLFAGLAILALLVVQNVFVLASALLLLLLLHASARTPQERVAQSARALLPLSAVVFVLRVIFQPVGEPLFSIGAVRITPLAAVEGLALVLRLYAMAFAVFVWLYTTDLDHLVLGMVRVGVPYAWGLVLALALRFIPTFRAAYEQIAQAQQARGLDLQASGAWRRLSRMMPILIAMVIGNLRASEQLARALEARGFGAPGMERSYRLEVHMRALDYMLLAGVLLALAALLYASLALGFATQPLRLLGS